ncbi:MAG: methyl-accepting chemotaxis protein [Actinobacteria bacterium]|nr:MAG: methyl-accepting chemotaxis protein [Actinomycetota bacterium]
MAVAEEMVVGRPLGSAKKSMEEEVQEVKFYKSLAVVYFGATCITIGPAVLGGLIWIWFADLRPTVPASISLEPLFWGSVWKMLVVFFAVGTPLWIIGFYQYILKPLRRIGDVMGEVAAGDLTFKTGLRRSDEVGVLALQLDRVIDGLSDIAGQVRGSSERVSSSAQQLSGSSEEINSSAMEISSSVQQIAQGAEVQAKKVEETSKATQVMTESMKRVARQAESTAETSEEAAQIAERGEKETDEAIAKITEVQEVISKSAAAVSLLGDRSAEIGKIVDVITNIADQTNLLALNAAIEAARAGESGRGFSVVAEEVRKLAEGSARAAEQISTLIAEVRDETSKAVVAMEKGTTEVAEGARVVNKAGEALKQIIVSVREMTTLAESISEGTRDQLEGTVKVEEAMNDIAAIVEENAAGAQQTAAATEEQTACMEEIASSAQELADMALRLDESVQQFKLA